MPTLSIVMNTYNRVELLKRCIASVISQSWKDWEMVIVDDHSQDSTPQFLKELTQRDARIRYFRNEKNEGADRKKAYSLISPESEYVIFLDDDDYYVDNTFFTRGLNVFQRELELSFVAGYADYGEVAPLTKEIQRYAVTRHFRGRVPRKEYLLHWGKGGYLKPLSTFPTIFSRDALDIAKIQDMIRVNDTAIYLRALLAGDAFWLEEPAVGVYYCHPTSISHRLSSYFIIDALQEYLITLEKAQQQFPDSDFLAAKRSVAHDCVNYYVIDGRPSFRNYVRVAKFLRTSAPRLFPPKQFMLWSYKVLRWNVGAFYGSLVNRFKKKTTE